MKLAKVLLLLTLIASTGYAMAQAASPADDQIAARQAEMKANGKAMAALVSILKGETKYDPAFVKANVEAMTAAVAATAAAKGWDPTSQQGTLETLAKPEIWTDPEAFTAAQKAVDTALINLAATTDEASFKAAFMALATACKNCHEKFRRAKG